MKTQHKYGIIGAATILALMSMASVVFAETGEVQININTVTTISVSNTPMIFTLDPGVADENGDDNVPFLLDNNGTVNLDISLCGQDVQWAGTSGASDKNYLRYIADDNEAGSCDTGINAALLANGYLDINTVTTQKSGGVCQGLKFVDATDSIDVGIKALAPTDEPNTLDSNVTITFYVAQDTTGNNDSLQSCT